METKFREIAKVYSNYKRFERKENDNLKAELADTKYSREYKMQLQAESKQKLSNERETVANRLNVIRKEIVDTLSWQHDFINNFDKNYMILQRIKLYTENCTLSANEWQRLAESKKFNLTVSRFINETAKKQGFLIDNYNSYDEIVDSLDKLISDINQSINAVDAFHAIYINDKDVESACGKCYAIANNHHVNITVLPVPHSLEQTLINESILQGKDVSPIANKAFIEAFTGQKLKEKKAEDILTSEEKETASQLANLDGRTEIDDTDVAKVRAIADGTDTATDTN